MLLFLAAVRCRGVERRLIVSSKPIDFHGNDISSVKVVFAFTHAKCSFRDDRTELHRKYNEMHNFR